MTTSILRLLKARINLYEYMRDKHPYTGYYDLQPLDPEDMDRLHTFADVACEYLIHYGIPATYNRDWSTGRIICVYGNGKWRIDRYFLEVRLTNPEVTDIWVGLNVRQYVWTYITSDEVRGLYYLVPTVKRVIKKVEAWNYCSRCHYSDSTAQYCGKGLELMPGCTSFKGFDNAS